MTGQQLAVIRRQLCGSDTVKFGRALGITGKADAIASSVRRLEARDKKAIPLWYARLAAIYRDNPKLLES